MRNITKEKALYNFWSSFGLPAFEENAVPTGSEAPDYPYITYQVITDNFGNEIALAASVWYRSPSWVECNAKTEEIGTSIGRGGKMLHCDEGAIWIKRGSPFAQSMGDEVDDMIRRKLLNLSVEFMTEN